MEHKIILDYGNYRLIAELDMANVPDLPPTIYVFLEDKLTGEQQNLCAVRQHYELRCGQFQADIFPDLFDCLVWEDETKEDYTYKETIARYDFAQDEDD